MAAPKVNINRTNGNLNRVQGTADNVFGIMVSGVAQGSVALGVPKQFTGVADLTTYGITSGTNPLLVDEVTAFYALAGTGVKSWWLIYSDATTLSAACDKDTGVIRSLAEADTDISYLFVNKKMPSGYVATVTTGLDADALAANDKLQALCEQYASVRNQYFGAVLPGFSFTVAAAAALKDQGTDNNRDVSFLLASDASTGKPGIGQLAGWLAKNNYWYNAGRVQSGNVASAGWFVDGTAANAAAAVAALDVLHDKRYIFFRQFPQKSGYFYNDDPTCTAITDDYSSISWNRVMIKARKLAYGVLVEKLNSDVTLDPLNGGIAKSLAADWESDVRNALNVMVREGAISRADCTIDTSSVNVAADQVSATIEILRNGQAKTFNVDIGFSAS